MTDADSRVSTWSSVLISIALLLPVAVLVGILIAAVDPPLVIQIVAFGALGVCCGLLPPAIHERREERAKSSSAQ